MIMENGMLPLFDALPPATVKEQLRTLWHDVFGDSYEYIDAFFTAYPCDEVAHTLSVGGRVVSALYALPFTYSAGVAEYSAAYVYAVATATEYRGRGYMAHLMSEVERLLREQGVCLLFLLPASDALRGYYSRLGYADCSKRTVVEYAPRTFNDNCLLSQISSADDILSLWVGWQRTHTPVMLHSRELIALNIASCRLQGGGCYVAMRDGQYVAAAFVIEEGARCLLLDVAGCCDTACEELMAALCRSKGVESLSVIKKGCGTPFTMWRWIDNTAAMPADDIYISLMLDK